MSNSLEKLVLYIVLLFMAFLCWDSDKEIDRLKQKNEILQKQFIELKQEYKNFKEVTSNEIIGQWRSLARVRRNFQALKWGGLEYLDTERNEKTEKEIKESYARR
jgi:hypothetical protein